MSLEADIEYSLRAEQRRQAHLESVRETTESFLDRYRQTLEDMHREGTASYAADEVGAAEALLERADARLAGDPEGAMSLSRQLGQMMYGLAGRARRARAESMAANAAVRWSEHAAEVRAERAARAAREDAASALRDRRETVIAAPTAKSAAMVALAARLESLASRIESGAAAAADVHAELTRAETEMVMSATDEKLRRETLRAAMDSLQKSGFVFPRGSLKLMPDGLVRLEARRPSGESCVFLVRLDGSMRYDFSGYRGSSCKKDIGAVFSRLKDVYGMNFSDERVLRRNPDEIGREAKSLENERTV